MKTKMLLASLATGFLFLTSMAASATPVAINQWYAFGFGGPGSALESGSGITLPTNPAGISAPDAPWTFTLSAPGELTVLDLFNSIDQFEIFNFGVSLGHTSTPVSGGPCYGDITCALADMDYSRGIFNLAPGSYSITGTQLTGTSGGGAFMVSTRVASVPEPGAIWLFALGLGILGTLRFTRKTA